MQFKSVLLAICFLVFQSTADSQTINIVRFNNTASYYPGGSISVHINPTGVFDLTNIFYLDLSDASGNFAATPNTIATVNEFFTPLINATIPAGTPTGAGYKLRVRASTAGANNIISSTFSIGSTPSPALITPAITPLFQPQTNCLSTNPPFLGWLNISTGVQTSSSDIIIDDFSATEIYNVTIVDLFSSATTTLINPAINSGVFTFPSGKPTGYYTIEIERKKNTQSSIKSFVFQFNTGNTNLGNTSNETVCADSTVKFTVDTLNIKYNYPLSRYTVNFGDGTPVKTYTHAQFMADSTLRHIYTTPTCQSPFATLDPSNRRFFKIDIKLLNKGIDNASCQTFQENGNGTTKWANSGKPPQADFTVASNICINTTLTATNTSTPGQYGTSTTCNSDMFTVWKVKKPGDPDFVIVAASTGSGKRDLSIAAVNVNIPGCWVLRLEVNNAQGCPTKSILEKTIGVAPTPTPGFKILKGGVEVNAICIGESVTLNNESNLVGVPCQNPSYSWTISPNSGFTYIGSTSSTSSSPQLTFNTQGTYNITQNITNSCGTFQLLKTLNVNSAPTVSIPAVSNPVCKFGPADTVLDFSLNAIKPNYSTGSLAPSTFLWQVNGSSTPDADWSFSGGTTAASQFPKIQLKTFRVYTIKVTVDGGCGNSNATYTFDLRERPRITNTDIEQRICSGVASQPFTLTANMNNTSFVWTTTIVPGASVTGVTNVTSGVTIPGTTLSNTTGNVGAVNFAVTATTNGCSVNGDFKVFVHPKPAVPTTNAVSLCINQAANALTATVLSGHSLTWYTVATGGTGSSTAPTPNTTTAGTTTYYVSQVANTAPNCESNRNSITVTVNPLNTAASPSANPTLCANQSLSPSITIATTGATGIGIVSGLPSGVNATWNNNTITISGTPTSSGTFNYSIALSGGCGTINATGTITVTAGNSAASPSANPSLCVNTSLTDITINTTGAAAIGAPTGMPAGVTATWNNNVITISGTPTVTGVFNYSIPLTGGCGNVNATGTITVLAGNTASSPSSKITCVNMAMSPNITINTGGATGIGTASGLPSGITANWSNNVITISGTPTVTGVFNYSIPLSGGCGTVSAAGSITVNATNTAAAPSASPSVCISVAIAPITIATTGATGIGSVTGLPTGVTASWNNNTITISGTPTVAGTFNYSIPLTGGCGTVNAAGTITVLTNTVSSPSANPSVCINTALPANITFTTTDATGIGIPTNLPAGLTATWNNNTITISGTPTAAGNFNYTIPLTGGCGNVNATGTITVIASNTATSPASKTTCVNVALSPNITITTGGATGIGIPIDLPAGLTATWSNNIITISGTPTATGTFNYSIPLTGGCGTINATGTINVNATNTASTPSANPTVCINSALSSITITTTGASGIGSATGLPSGVTASFNNNTITISGTPTVAGVFNYSIPLTGGCGNIIASGTITVLINTVTSASATPSVCVNTALSPDITFTTTEATGIGAAAGLPAGLNASWNNHTITISGTPTVTGNFNYTIPLIGGCGTVNATGTLTVVATNTAATPSANPTLCINTALSPAITIATTGATGIGTPSDLPAGVTAVWNNNVITISGTPTTAGTFNYSIPLTGGCGTITSTGTITVTPENTAGTASANPTLCINSPLTSITITTTGATGIGTPTNLPAGVTANWNNDLITISGTPTAAGTFNYSIPLTGGCANVIATGTITVEGNTVSNAALRSVCVNETMTPDIIITTTGATGIGTPTGLPAGLNAVWNNHSLVISGTPTATGVFNYSIPLTGGCGNVSATGTITVIASNTVAASAPQVICINTPLPSITLATTGATGIGTVTGLPTGVTASWNNNNIIISGTPTSAGTFSYTIPLSGGCGTVAASGSITVTPDNTVSAASANPTLCINTVLSPDISFTTTGATGIGTPTNLPAGLTATWNNNTITISGSPTASGTFNYSIRLTGGCGDINATGTITVSANNTAAVSPPLTVCINTAISPNITIATTGATGIGTPTNLPAGLTATWNNDVITISGTANTSGVFNYTIPLTGGCGIVNATGSIQVTAANTVGAASSDPTLCINTPLAPITITTTGSTGIGTPTGLPTGVTASFNNNTITLTGTPSTAGTYNYSIPLTGGCGSFNATGTITVLTNTVTTPSITPSLCINAAISPDITFATTLATGIGTPTGLPSGVTATWNNNTITISGTPTVSGIFNYSIPLTGGCGTVNATGTIDVKPRPIVQTMTTTTCSGQTFTLAPSDGNGNLIPTGTTYSWLAPVTTGGITGVAGNGNSISGTLTNNTPIPQTATYTVTPSATNCPGNDFTVIVTINPTPNISFSIADQTSCSGSATQPVTITSSTPGAIIQWNTSFPAGISASPATTNGTTQIPSYTFTNSTAIPIDVSFATIVATAGNPSCPGPGATYTITVYPTTPPPTTQALVEYCHNDVASALTASATPPNTLLWYTPTSQVSTVAPVPATSVVGSFIYHVSQVSPTTPACESEKVPIEVRIKPIPQIAVSAVAPTTCNSNNGVMTISGLFVNTTYELFYVVNNVLVNSTINSNAGGDIVVNNLVGGIYRDIRVILNGCPSNNVAGPFNLVNPDVPATPTTSGNSPICEGATLQLNAVSLTPDVTYEWTGPNGYTSSLQNPQIVNAAVTRTGKYKVVARANNCVSFPDSIEVVVNPNPVVDLGPDLQLLPPAKHILSPTILNGPISEYTWTPTQNLSCTNCPNPTANIISSTTYQLTVRNSNGCIGQDDIHITAICAASVVYIPNAFVPNSATNSIFRIRSVGPMTVKNFRIFNRWGELVFERANFPTNDVTYGWDGRINGTLANPDVFVYTVEVNCESGSTLFFKGNVTLLR